MDFKTFHNFSFHYISIVIRRCCPILMTLLTVFFPLILYFVPLFLLFLYLLPCLSILFFIFLFSFPFILLFLSPHPIIFVTFPSSPSLRPSPFPPPSPLLGSLFAVSIWCSLLVKILQPSVWPLLDVSIHTSRRCSVVIYATRPKKCIDNKIKYIYFFPLMPSVTVPEPI